MRVRGHGGNKRFTYDGEKGLEAEMQKCEKELEKKTTDVQRARLRWAYEKAKREYEAYERRITDLSGFIEVARKELEKK